MAAPQDVSTKLCGAPYPPRPRAIATFLSSRSFLPGCQTMLHSLKTHLAPTPKDRYPPEIIVILSSKITETKYSYAVRDLLHQTFCDRIVEVEHIPIAKEGGAENGGSEGKPSHVQSWDENCGWTKLRLFELDGYDTILYIDADCLVTKDVGHLLRVDEADNDANEAEKRVGLLAAAPDIFPPDKFNAGVMVLRPSKSVFEDMMSRLPGSNAKEACTSYDGGDTGFLNSYYPGWYSEMPAYSRLPFGYNAQRFMYHCTAIKRPQYWDDAIDDVTIIHYSSSPKPWEKKAETSSSDAKEQQSYLDRDGVDSVQKVTQSGKLERTWQEAYEKSKSYHAKECKKRKAPERKAPPKVAPKARARPQAHAAKANPQNVHKMVNKRFKELRKSGLSMQDAMAAARAEYGLDKTDNMDPSRAVGQMFGLM